MIKYLRTFLTLGLAAALIFATAPSAGASSYYQFIRQQLLQEQTPPVVTEPEVTEPVVTQPASPINFWTSRTAARNALLTGTTTQPAPAPAPAPAPTPAPAPAPTPTPAPTPAPAPATQLTPREQAMLNLINRDRIAAGLRPLQADLRLTRLARIKSQDIVDNQYFAHTSPTLGSAFDMMRSAGISFIRAGENLSKAGGVEISHLRLMNSTNHRANLMNPHFTHVGIGIVNNIPSGIVATQMFIQAP